MKALSCLKPTPVSFRIGLHTAASSGLFCFAVGEMTVETPCGGFNREWHAIVENAAPAAQFEAFLLYDLEQASKAAPEAVEVEGPMTVLSRDYFEREEAEPEAAVTCSTGTTWPRSAAPKTRPPLSWSEPRHRGPPRTWPLCRSATCSKASCDKDKEVQRFTGLGNPTRWRGGLGQRRVVQHGRIATGPPG